MSLRKYWQNNVKKNMKKISANIGDIVITLVTIGMVTLKGGIDFMTMIIMMLFAVKPFLFTYLNLVFKGETDDLITINSQLVQQLKYDREISEYKIQLAAIKGSQEKAVKANMDWNDANDPLEDLNCEIT